MFVMYTPFIHQCVTLCALLFIHVSVKYYMYFHFIHVCKTVIPNVLSLRAVGFRFVIYICALTLCVCIYCILVTLFALCIHGRSLFNSCIF
ncbi:hypothetical protein FKM82_013854 [Ascaphus truei]